MIAGGEGLLAWEVKKSVELFEAGDFVEQSDVALKVARSGSVAVTYPDHVLVIGGWEAPDKASSAVDWIHFDEEQPRVEQLFMKYDRAEHSAVLVESGGIYEVYICGGLRYDQGSLVVVDSCELLNPDNDTSTEHLGVVRRWGHTATVLQDGRMLLAGGFSSVPPTLGHTATLLPNGMVVLIGGVAQMGAISMASQDYEIFNPRPRQ